MSRPAPEAFRWYKKSDSGRRVFQGVIVLCHSYGQTVEYRYAGESTIRTMQADEWDGLDLKPSDFLYRRTT